MSRKSPRKAVLSAHGRFCCKNSALETNEQNCSLLRWNPKAALSIRCESYASLRVRRESEFQTCADGRAPNDPKICFATVSAQVTRVAFPFGTRLNSTRFCVRIGFSMSSFITTLGNCLDHMLASALPLDEGPESASDHPLCVKWHCAGVQFSDIDACHRHNGRYYTIDNVRVGPVEPQAVCDHCCHGHTVIPAWRSRHGVAEVRHVDHRTNLNLASLIVSIWISRYPLRGSSCQIQLPACSPLVSKNGPLMTDLSVPENLTRDSRAFRGRLSDQYPSLAFLPLPKPCWP
jgi:hypothetical protein